MKIKLASGLPGAGSGLFEWFRKDIQRLVDVVQLGPSYPQWKQSVEGMAGVQRVD